MSIKGGYKIIDLKGATLTPDAETPVTVPGVYERIEGNHGKALLLSGFSIGSVESPDRFVNLDVGANSVYHGVIGSDADENPLIISINDDDEITVTTLTDE